MTTLFAIHSTARSRHHRTHRAANPGNRRRKQYVGEGQHRLLSGRPVILTEEQLLAARPELMEKLRLGLIEIRLLDGRQIDLETLEAAPVAPSPKMPEPVLDSIANDVPMLGEKMAPQGVPMDAALEGTPELIARLEEAGGLLEEEAMEIPLPPAVPVDLEAVLPSEEPSDADSKSDGRKKGKKGKG